MTPDDQPTPRAGRRRRWLTPALAALVLLAGGAAGWQLSHQGATLPAQTLDRTQLAAAEQVLAALPLPPGATRDPSATACAVPSPVCATSPTVSPRALADGLYDALRSSGFHGRALSCPDPAEQTYRTVCSGYLTYRDAVVELRSGDASGAGAVADRSWVAARLAQEHPEAQAGAPLSSWASLGVQPAGWTGSSSCTRPAPEGCRQWDGRLTGPGDVATAGGRLAETLAAAGFRLDQLGCPRATASSTAAATAAPASGGRCVVAAGRFRRAGGADAVIVTAVLDDRADGRVTALVTVATP